MTTHTITRRNLVASGLALSGMGAMLAGCATPRFSGGRPLGGARAYGFGALKPLDLSLENLIKITVCTRPFRAAGPRLEAATLNGKTIVN